MSAVFLGGSSVSSAFNLLLKIKHKEIQEMKKIRVAFIGSGFIQNYHAKGLQSQKDVNLVTVADINFKAAKEFANKYGITETTDDV